MKRKGLVIAAGFVAALAGVNLGMVPRLMAADPAPATTPADESAVDEISGRFLLTAMNNRPVSTESFDGKIRLMAFGYTYCPDVCPTTLGVMAAALDELGPDAEQVVPLFISVDPRRDTPEHLRSYLSAFGPSFIGLTGSKEQIDAAARAFKARYAIVPPQPNEDPRYYVVDHSAGIYVMGRQGQFMARLGHAASPREVADRIRQIIKRGG
ncbi:MAG: SCO family protein [Solirubrobacterales bacterium]